MAGANGPTSAAGTKDIQNPDAKPDEAGAPDPAEAVDVETPTAKPGDRGFSLDKDAQD